MTKTPQKQTEVPFAPDTFIDLYQLDWLSE